MTTPPASFRIGDLMPISEVEHIALLWLAAYEAAFNKPAGTLHLNWMMRGTHRLGIGPLAGVMRSLALHGYVNRTENSPIRHSLTEAARSGLAGHRLPTITPELHAALQAPKLSNGQKKRRCLRCKETFTSTWAGNRMCKKCGDYANHDDKLECVPVGIRVWT